MKIKATSLSNTEANVITDEQYEVLTFCKNLSTGISYGLIFDNSDHPVLVNLDKFYIISSDKAPEWIISLNSQYLSMSPNSFFTADFWDDYFDDTEEAKKRFYEESLKFQNR